MILKERLWGIMNRMKRMASDANLDVYGLGTDKAKWDARLEEYTESIVQHCIWQFGQTRTEPCLMKFIMDGLTNES
jgi:hypothetical protein